MGGFKNHVYYVVAALKYFTEYDLGSVNDYIKLCVAISENEVYNEHTRIRRAHHSFIIPDFSVLVSTCSQMIC